MPPRRASTRAVRPDARLVVTRLAQLYPGATTALAYRSPFELLAATILSAQSTDARVNQVTPALFARFPDAKALAAAEVGVLERLVQSTGFFRTKARALLGMAQRLVERHGGEVPPRMADLVALPGVGRKTANVVLGHALGVPGLPVDRHVLRVANRIGLAKGDDAEAVERQLCKVLPDSEWVLASDCLILHGRRVCRPKPVCARCNLQDACAFYRFAPTPPPVRPSERRQDVSRPRRRSRR
jgi:endonuclease III